MARRPLGARQRERRVQQGQQRGVKAQGCQGERDEAIAKVKELAARRVELEQQEKDAEEAVNTLLANRNIVHDFSPSVRTRRTTRSSAPSV